ANPGFFHRHALRPRRRFRHLLPHDRRIAAAVHDGLHGLAGGGMSMDKRAERTRRVLTIQEQLHRVERWKLLELQRRATELDALRRELIAALNDNDALQGLFLDATARRLMSIAQQVDEMRRQEQAQLARVSERVTRVACAE